MPQQAIEQLSTDVPIAEMILSNVSDRYQHPIYPNYATGGTNVINAPRGYRYKARLDATATSLTVEIVFLPVPVDAGAEPTQAPPQVEEPAPGPTRIEINQAGTVVVSSLSADAALH
jgi:hypothetical protein